MKTKIAFYKGKGRFFNGLVRWWTNGQYSHTEVITHTDRNNISTCYSSSEQDGGMRKKLMRLNPEHWDIVELNIDPTKVEQWYLPKLGIKYDYLGLLGFIFRRGQYSRRKYFCSEANAASIGIMEAWRFDPNSLKVIVDKIKETEND